MEVHSADYPSLYALVEDFLTQAGISVEVASFAVPGPVIAGHVKTTNLPWVMDESSLASQLQLEAVHLMNDLEAAALAVPLMRDADLGTINQSKVVPNG